MLGSNSGVGPGDGDSDEAMVRCLMPTGVGCGRVLFIGLLVCVCNAGCVRVAGL